MDNGSNLISPGLSKTLNDLYTNYTQLVTSSNLILNQGDFSLNLLPTLPTDQAVMKQHMIDFSSDISIQILDVFQLFASAGILFKNFSTYALPIAKDLDTLPPSDKNYASELKSFDSILTALQNVIAGTTSSNSTHSEVNTIKENINDFYNEKIETDKSTFDEDLKIGITKYKKDVSELSAKLNSLQDQLNSLNEQLAGGAVSQIPQALEFGWSIGSMFESPTAAGSMGINIGMAISDEILKDINFDKEYKELSGNINSTIGEYKKTVELLKDEEQEIAILTTISNQVDLFASHIQTTITLLGDIDTSLSNLYTNFSIIIDLDHPWNSNNFEAIINQATIFWSKIEGDCIKYISALDNDNLSSTKKINTKRIGKKVFC